MARNGSGTYSNPYPNFVSGTVISSSETDANNSDIATALTQSIAVDGQTTVTANLPMNSNKFTGLAVGAAATDSLSLGQAQAEAFIWCGTASGSANAITLSPSPAITAYAAGQRFVWMASGSVNTGATTAAISGLSTIALQDNGAALVAGNHAAGKMFMGILNTTSTMQIMQVQISGTDPLIISSLTVNGASQLNGTLTAGVDDTGYDVKFFGDTASRYWLWDTSADGVVQRGTLTVGVDDTGHDVKFFGATSGAYMLWDESADDLKLVGAAGMTVAGDIDVDGTTNLDAVDIDGAVQIDGIVQVGVDGTGYDVKLFGDTSGKSLLWDQSADSLIVTGTTTLVGTTNLDAVDIDGATQIDGTVTVGVDDTGYDVKFFGATSGAHLLWDESADDLKLVGAAGMTVAGDIDVDGTTNLDAVDIDGATQIDGTVTVGVDDTGYDVKFFGATSGAYMLWDESADDLKLVGAAGMTVAGDADIGGTLEADAMTLNGTAITTTATLSTGISNNNVPKFTSGVADDDFLRVAGTAIEGRSASEVLGDIAAAPAAGSSNVVTTGALNSGSITSGFGAIDNGSSNITTTGNLSGGELIASSGNLLFQTGSKGVYLGVTSATAANLLADYEEGTWTATLTGSTSDPSSAVTTTSYYTKIGDLVYVWGFFSGVNSTGAGGGIRITGLPFTPSPASQMSGDMSIHTGGTVPSGTVNVSPSFESSYIAFYSSISQAGWSEITHNATGAMWLNFSGTYKT